VARPSPNLSPPAAARDDHRRALRETKEAVELATLKWVSWFIHNPLSESIGHILPAEAEANCDRQITEQAMSVLRTPTVCPAASRLS